MKCLVVIAHPARESLCYTLATRAVETLRAAGHEVVIEDLYQNEFAKISATGAMMTNKPPLHAFSQADGEIAKLISAEGIVLCFPTWWFGFPAILKGWFDRIWESGVAYDHANEFGPIKPRLHKLRQVLAVTSLGSPWWIDWLAMRRPVRRVLKSAILGTCAPASRFEMLSLYNSQHLTVIQVKGFASKIEKILTNWS